MRLKDKVVIVTGTSRGIGAEIASIFTAEGAGVVLAAKSMEEMEQLWQSASRQGGESVYVGANVRGRESTKNMVRTACDAYGAVDILANNAGYPMFGYVMDDEDEEVEKRYETIAETNVRGYWHGARFAVPYMKEGNKDSIINISSVGGHLGLADEIACCATKSAVKVMAKALTIELAPYNIHVSCIPSGAIQVKISRWALPRYGQEAYDEYVEKLRDAHLLGVECNQPLYMIGEPRDIGCAAIYLASEEARFVTGSDIVVDGGLAFLSSEPSALGMEILVALHGKQGPMNQWFQSLG